MGDYKGLVVWQREHESTLAIMRLVDAFPNKRSAWAVASQLVRAAGSRGANIAEGHGRQLIGGRKRDYANFLEIALGSAQETDNWLTVARDAGFVAPEVVDPLLQQNEEVRKMLYVMAARCRSSVPVD